MLAHLFRKVAAAPGSTAGVLARAVASASLLVFVVVLPGAATAGESGPAATDARQECSQEVDTACPAVEEQLGTLYVLPSLWGRVGVSPPASNGEVECVSAPPMRPDELFTCPLQYEIGTRVTLTARAAQGQRFFGWSVFECPGRRACELTVTPERSITAIFNPAVLALEADFAPGGVNEAVVSDLPGILCRTNDYLSRFCMALFPANRLITFTARTRRTIDWGANCRPVTGSPSSCRTDSTAVFVTVGIGAPAPGPPFGERSHLSVRKLGRGTVTGPGIRCGLDCGQWYDTGTRITLWATARRGWAFRRWEGRVNCPRRFCSLSVGGHVTSVRAVFRRV
jgi:hypothetical protein